MDEILNLVLSFNLHFCDYRLNIVMNTLESDIESFINLSERIMIIVNRGTGLYSFIHDSSMSHHNAFYGSTGVDALK